MFALYVRFLRILLEELLVVVDVVVVVVVVVVVLLLVVVVFVVLVVVLVWAFTGVKSGCALSINPGILFAFSSERLMKISCHL
jgi:uncharacterized membrane protein YdbT with pleckstrin-like domain